MTTSDTAARIPSPEGRFRLPDPPERGPDDMTSAEHLSETGLRHHLKQFLGHPETTIVSGEKYVTARRGAEMRYPDLMVAFDVDPAAYREANGYVVSEQGKPPELVLEIASEGTGHVDVGEKREFYQRLGIPEYWRFDASGEYHGTRLAGERAVRTDRRCWGGRRGITRVQRGVAGVLAVGGREAGLPPPGHWAAHRRLRERTRPRRHCRGARPRAGGGVAPLEWRLKHRAATLRRDARTPVAGNGVNG